MELCSPVNNFKPLFIIPSAHPSIWYFQVVIYLGTDQTWYCSTLVIIWELVFQCDMVKSQERGAFKIGYILGTNLRIEDNTKTVLFNFRFKPYFCCQYLHILFLGELMWRYGRWSTTKNVQSLYWDISQKEMLIIFSIVTESWEELLLQSC